MQLSSPSNLSREYLTSSGGSDSLDIEFVPTLTGVEEDLANKEHERSFLLNPGASYVIEPGNDC